MEDPTAFPEALDPHPLVEIESRFHLESTVSMLGNFVMGFSNARLQ